MQNKREEAMELLPCPFCGSEAEMIYGLPRDRIDGHKVRCKKLCVERGYYYLLEDAAQNWNRRDGAASIDRREIVREVFEEVRKKAQQLYNRDKFDGLVFGSYENEAMDAVLADLEVKG